VILPKPFYQDESCTIYNADCREILPLLPKVDLVLTDPPYGLGHKLHDGGTWSTNPIYDAMTQWDLAPVDRDRLDLAISKGRQAIVWGGNYFSMPPSRCWLAWVKSFLPTLADMELAWTNMDANARKFDSNRNPDGKRQHPTQKPLELMRWCIGLADGITILDPFMGSGTTLRAAKDLGRRAIGIEINKAYCAIAAERLRQEVLPLETTTPATPASAPCVDSGCWWKALKPPI
jgi:site-specific DNA-methyltransferase (adenine-specific)